MILIANPTCVRIYILLPSETFSCTYRCFGINIKDVLVHSKYIKSPAFVCTLPSVVYVCGISSMLLQPFLYVYMFVCCFFTQALSASRSPEFKLSLQRTSESGSYWEVGVIDCVR